MKYNASYMLELAKIVANKAKLNYVKNGRITRPSLIKCLVAFLYDQNINYC